MSLPKPIITTPITAMYGPLYEHDRLNAAIEERPLIVGQEHYDVVRHATPAGSLRNAIETAPSIFADESVIDAPRPSMRW